MIHYENQSGKVIGATKAEAVAYLKANSGASIYLWEGHDCDDVTSDIRDEITAAEEAAKTPDQINAEALAILAQTVLRLSRRVEALENEAAAQRMIRR